MLSDILDEHRRYARDPLAWRGGRGSFWEILTHWHDGCSAGAMQRQVACLALLSSLLVATSAAARPPAPPRPRHLVSVFLDGTGLSFGAPTVRPAIDLRLARKWSLSLSVGLGVRNTVAADRSYLGQKLAWDAAVRPRYFLLGDFEQGFHVGFALTFARVAGGGFSQQDLVEPPVGLCLGPTIGFQSTFFPLVSIDVEAGPLFRIITPSSAYQPSEVVPYGAFMIGRSF